MLNKKIKIYCLRNGYILEEAYYTDLIEVFKEYLKLIDDTDFKGKHLEITLNIKVVK
jgi:hypothetical protein